MPSVASRLIQTQAVSPKEKLIQHFDAHQNSFDTTKIPKVNDDSVFTETQKDENEVYAKDQVT